MILVYIYWILFILSVIPLFVSIPPPNGPLAGIFAILLTSPWFQKLQPLINNLAISLGVSALINSAILYMFSKALVYSINLASA